MSRMASSLLLLKAVWMSSLVDSRVNLSSIIVLGGTRSFFVPTTAQKRVASVMRTKGSQLAGCGLSFITEVPASLRSW
ncbi:hypothetical protein BC831DRAFT_445629 [Entophlyctis helioformis]|nr:hypothetical protein BC831DRAFT_445629 [Entophlyctis helioformis]